MVEIDEPALNDAQNQMLDGYKIRSLWKDKRGTKSSDGSTRFHEWSILHYEGTWTRRSVSTFSNKGYNRDLQKRIF